MAALTTITRLAGLDRGKWERAQYAPIRSAAVVAVGFAVVMAWNRFGGNVVDAPRSFVRMVLVTVWGWLALATAIWLLDRSWGGSTRPSLSQMVTATGLAHVPLVVLGMVVFVAAWFLRILGPGLVAAALVLGVWFPAVLVVAVRHTVGSGIGRAAALVALPYFLWLAVIGRHLLGQVGHLL